MEDFRLKFSLSFWFNASVAMVALGTLIAVMTIVDNRINPINVNPTVDVLQDVKSQLGELMGLLGGILIAGFGFLGVVITSVRR